MIGDAATWFESFLCYRSCRSYAYRHSFHIIPRVQLERNSQSWKEKTSGSRGCISLLFLIIISLPTPVLLFLLSFMLWSGVVFLNNHWSASLLSLKAKWRCIIFWLLFHSLFHYCSRRKFISAVFEKYVLWLSTWTAVPVVNRTPYTVLVLCPCILTFPTPADATFVWAWPAWARCNALQFFDPSSPSTTGGSKHCTFWSRPSFEETSPSASAPLRSTAPPRSARPHQFENLFLSPYLIFGLLFCVPRIV